MVIGLAKCSSWSRPSPAICIFFLFQNKDSLVPQMGNVMAIGLTPSRTGIVIGRLLNAQLRHMSVRAAWRHKSSLFWPQTRCRKLHNTVWLYKARWSFPSHFPSLLNTLLMPVRILLSLSFQVNCYNLQRPIFCNKHGTLINKTNKNTPLPCYKPNIKLQTCKMFKCKKKTDNHQTPWHQMNKKKTNKSKTNKAWRHGIQLDVK